MSYLESWVPVFLLFLEIFLLMFIARWVAQFLARKNFDSELTTKDNPAAGLAVGGYHLGFFLALCGLLVESAHASEGMDLSSVWVKDALMLAIHGWVAMSLLLVSAVLWKPIFGVALDRDIFQSRNVASGLVCGAGLIATGLIYQGCASGDGPFITALVFFALGQASLFLVSLLYEWITPYNLREEIRDKQNIAAAIGYSGALVAAGLIVGHAASGDFTSWSESTRDFFLFLIPLLTFPIARWFVGNGIFLGFKNINIEISRDRNTAAGVMEAVAYLGMAICLVRLL